MGRLRERVVHRVWRVLAGLQRPSPRANRKRLAARQEAVASLVIRDGQPTDLPALAELHVRTWNDTYAPLLLKGPSIAVREQQWRDKFRKADPGWFCLVAERPSGELIGFAEGRRQDDSPAAELSKLYLAREYQGVGLGRRLLCLAVDRFLRQGLTSMAVYVDPRNPSCGFWEALGGVNLREPDGSINYSWYVWPDLGKVAARCSRSSATGAEPGA